MAKLISWLPLFRHTSEKAILIAAHGSKSKNNESAAALQARLLTEKGYKNIHYAFKGYSEPRIQEILTDLESKGFREIVAIPLFMAPGHYADKVIPRQLGLPEGSVSGTSPGGAKISITGVIGTHPLAGKIALNEALGLSKGKGKKGVLFIGHGSKSPDAMKMVFDNVEKAKETFPHVYAAFNEFNEPTVGDALETMAADGIDEILAVPLFVSSGGHTEEDLPEALGLFNPTEGRVTVSGRDMDVRYGRPFGELPAVSAIMESLLEPHLR